ncbi:MAG: MBOAT family O-acyltransferase [Bacteroidales bacterium]|nr:MBOAT family protein [Bacteroidales bacterium]MDY0216747.1 MBOAT family O-acyltransferase [Bacteroidales bacterium]
MELKDILDFLTRVLAFDQNSPLLFTQFYFWAFFAIVFACFSLMHNRRLLRNSFLFFASILFYYKTSGLFFLILLFSTVSDFALGQAIYKSKSLFKQKFFVTTSVIINLATLFYFKYAYFFTDSYNQLFHTNLEVFNYIAHWSNNIGGTSFDVSQIMLPVGISFYTFQTISYSVDVYRKKLKPVTNILDFGFYVSFFPQLVAGPIVRASEFIPQLYQKYRLSRLQFGIAVFWILNGLVKKMILSDYLAVNFIDRVFGNPLMFSGFENLMALFGYSLQVYADFSGYTDIAIGVALLMGFRLPVNFNSPYKATNPGNFWKRWHISLSTWLKDYLYIPLGGNRRGSFGTFFWIAIIAVFTISLSGRTWPAIAITLTAISIFLASLKWPVIRKSIVTNINLMVTMLLGGLWHGASWNFMIWGGLNGAGILSYKFWRKQNINIKALSTFGLFGIFILLDFAFPSPLVSIGMYWTGIIFIGTFLDFLYQKSKIPFSTKWINRAWSIFLTFVFITFTRLFFRSGSNLDPAESNRIAWETASNMVKQIGSTWNTAIIGDILYEYRKVFIVFTLGMIIHWLPSKFKQWYRINFAFLPKWVQLLAVVLTVFVIYQFITAELQSFIYFQF